MKEVKPTIPAADSIDAPYPPSGDVNWNITTDDISHSSMDYELKRIVPIPSDSIEKMYKETGSKENTMYHKILEQKCVFPIVLFLVN